jgi:ankyrin repeat protein
VIPAVIAGDEKNLKLLLDDSAHVNINWQAGGVGESALSTAASFNKIIIVELLLARGANPNVATDRNETPLQIAAYNGNVEIVRMLIEAGAKVDAADTQYGFTALASAARNGHVGVIRLLLNAGADPSRKIVDGRTPLDLAKHYGHELAAKELASS